MTSMWLARQLADELAAEMLAAAGLNADRPSDIDDVARGLGVIFHRNDEIRCEGRFMHTAVGPIIEFNGKRPLTRQRFTKAHELVHLWLARPEPSRVTRAAQGAFFVEEELCDIAGAALLLPRAWVGKHSDFLRAPENHTMTILGRWAANAGVSREVAAIRLRDVLAWPKILLTWEKHGLWRFTGECGVRPWEYGQMRPEANVAECFLPEAAASLGHALERTLGMTINGRFEDITAELAVDGVAGYALISNPFCRASKTSVESRRGS